MGEETTERLLSFLSSITIDDCVLHINTYASANITHIIERFKVLHHCQVMVDNRELLKEMIAFRAKALQRYSSESMFGGVGAGIDFRARDFITTISILLPYMEDKEEEARVLKGQYTQIKANLGDFGAACFGAYDLVKMIRELLVPQSITEVNGYDDHRWLNQQMTNSSSIGKVNDDSSYHIGNKYSKTLTTQTFPLNIDIDEYRGLFYSLFVDEAQIAIPCPYMVSLVVVFKNTQHTKKAVDDKAKWDMGQLTGIPIKYINKNPNLKDRKEESRSIITY